MGNCELVTAGCVRVPRSSKDCWKSWARSSAKKSWTRRGPTVASWLGLDDQNAWFSCGFHVVSLVSLAKTMERRKLEKC